MFIHNLELFFSFNRYYTTVNSNFTLYRRISIPFEKKKHVAINKFAVFLIKKSATNLFFSFSFDGLVLFSCSSGSAGLKKKERRRKYASSQIGNKFSKFVRYYYKTKSDFTPFRNILVHLQAPISYFRLFIRSFLSYYRNIFKHIRYRYNGTVYRYRRKSKILLKIYSKLANRFRFSLYKLHYYRKKIALKLNTFFFVHKLYKLIYKHYNCNLLSFFRFSFYVNNFSHRNYFSNFSLSDFFFFFSRQKSLFCRFVLNPPKKAIFSYLNKYLNIFSYFRHINSMFNSVDRSIYSNSFFFSFLDNYYFLKNDILFDSIDFFFFRVDSISSKYSEYRNIKLNSVIKNFINNKLKISFFFRYELSNVSFFFLQNLTIFSFFLKYSYSNNSFFSGSLYNSLKIFLFKSFIFYFRSDIKYKRYFFIFVKRLFFFFLSRYINSFSVSSNIFFFYRSFLNTLFSTSSLFFIDFFSTNNIIYRSRVSYISFSSYFVFYNFWFFNSVFVSSFFFPFSFLYYIWVREKLRFFSFFFHLAVAGTSLGTIRISKQQLSRICSFFFISKSTLLKLPKRYIFQMLNVHDRSEVINLVVFWVRNNVLILPEWKILLSSESSFSSFNYNYNYNKMISSFSYIKDLFFFFSFFSYNSIYIFSVNFFFSFSKYYIFFFKSMITSYFYSFLSFFLLFIKILKLFRYFYFFFFSFFFFLNWRSYFFSIYRTLFFLHNNVRFYSRELFFIKDVVTNFNIHRNKSGFLRSSKVFFFNIFFFYDRGSFPYNGCRNRRLF